MQSTTENKKTPYASSRNACKLCAPLGASVVFKGIEGCVPMIHGSQGCATYIRRYMISHYKEPVDIASSNFSETTTIYGGNRNFIEGINNVIRQYSPLVIGIATTCLAETIGEDVNALVAEYKQANEENPLLPVFIHASTPSYQGSHMDGFHEAVYAAVATLADKNTKSGAHINLFPGFVSPADLRNLKEMLTVSGIEYVLLPDYSASLDNPFWKDYHLVPEGGTPLNHIRMTGGARASIEFGTILNKGALTGRIRKTKTITTAGEWLEEHCDVPNHRMRMPIGIDATDHFIETIETISGKKITEKYKLQRGRLVDSYIDGHKYVFGKKAIVIGDEDMVSGLVSFLSEIGIIPVIVASGGESGLLKEEIEAVVEDPSHIQVMNGADFESIREVIRETKPDLLIGSSKGYYIARELGIPLIRVGFPIHDRVGGPRMEHLFYSGAQQLFDRIVNALLEYKQEHSPIGYKYM
jgi:nitrogenase molybdenum-iron protein NifN